MFPWAVQKQALSCCWSSHRTKAHGPFTLQGDGLWFWGLLVCAAEEPACCPLHIGFEVLLCLCTPLGGHKHGHPYYTLTLKLLWGMTCCACVRCRKPELGKELVSLRYKHAEGSKREVLTGMCSHGIFSGGIAWGRWTPNFSEKPLLKHCWCIIK